MPKKDDSKPEAQEDAKPAAKTVCMKRVLQPGQSGPTTADVHSDEVDNWRLHGWHLNTE